MSWTIQELLSFNQRGLFPGPQESPEKFRVRIDQQLAYQNSHTSHDFVSAADWCEARKELKRCFDFDPDWATAFYRREKLAFWEAAAAWDDQGASVIQLHPSFKKGRFGLVSRKEVLAHEAAHTARGAFEEPRFEEILCYKTSSSLWRRKVGALFRSPWETRTLLILLMGSLFGSLFWYSAYLFLLPILWFFICAGRLLRDELLLCRCLHGLSFLTSQPLALAFRLSDHEIVQFAQSTPDAISLYARTQSLTSWRWNLLYTAYVKMPKES